MKILLILVATPEMKPMEGVLYPIMAPPLTLPLLAEICRGARSSPEVETLDSRFSMQVREGAWVFDKEDLLAQVEGSGADIVAISFLSSSAAVGFEIASHCRSLGKTVIGGGLHASVALDEFLESGAFHYVVQGEAYVTVPLLLDDLAAQKRERHPGQTVVLRAEPLRDLSVSPPIRDFSSYARIYEQGLTHRVLYVELSRGCFKDCTFCEVARTGVAFRPLRIIPLENILRWLPDAIEKYGINYLLVADSIATAVKSHFLAFVDFVKRRFPELTLHFNSTVDRWDEEIAEACQGVPGSVWFGFESGSQRVLDEIIQKGVSVEQAYRAAEICDRYEISCGFNVLLGLPGETDGDYRDTMQVFADCPWVYPNPNIFNPLPGTALYRYCQERNLLRAPRDYRIWSAEDLEERKAGPVLGVDYERVLRYHGMLKEIQGKVEFPRATASRKEAV